jgi:hypothetical protein
MYECETMHKKEEYTLRVFEKRVPTTVLDLRARQ